MTDISRTTTSQRCHEWRLLGTATDKSGPRRCDLCGATSSYSKGEMLAYQRPAPGYAMSAALGEVT
jgi:hypothetical protein